jgi:hypothetical protein
MSGLSKAQQDVEDEWSGAGGRGEGGHAGRCWPQQRARSTDCAGSEIGWGSVPLS